MLTCCFSCSKYNLPHCIIKCSEGFNKNGKILETIETVNQELIKSKLFDNKTIKTRATRILNYLVGRNKTHFIHISIKFLEGSLQHILRYVDFVLVNE